MVPLITRLWNRDSRLRDFPKITWEGCSRARNQTELLQNAAQWVPHTTNPPILFPLCFPQHPFLLTNCYSSWQTLDVCYAQHWAHTGYRNNRSSYWLGSIWGNKGHSFFFRQFTGLCTLSLFLLYYSANNLLHHYKEETADLMQLIDNLIQSVSSFIKTRKTQ